jgi:acetyltransferase
MWCSNGRPAQPGRKANEFNSILRGLKTVHTAVEYRVQTHCRDSLCIRPARPEDANAQVAFFGSLSPRSRYSRFMAPLSELPKSFAQRLTEIAPSRFILLAEFPGAGGIVGEARYVLDERSPADCEFALSVADRWQGSGIGYALMQKLRAHAASGGVGHMLADTLASNERALSLARKLSCSVSAHPEEPRLYRICLSLAQRGGAGFESY